jgi:hypothetical protein
LSASSQHDRRVDGHLRLADVLPLRHGGIAFDGLPYARLPIDGIDWRHRGERLRRRAVLARARGDAALEPEWATEAALDPRRLVGGAGGRSHLSVRVVGHSRSAGMLLTVVLVPKRRPPDGEWWGATAWTADEPQRRAYREAAAGRGRP